MQNKITRYAAMFILIIGIAGLVYVLTPGATTGNGVAFAGVIQHFQEPGYTFRLTLDAKEQTTTGQLVKVLEPGRLRMDLDQNDKPFVSSIMDLKQRRCLLLFHQQKAAQLIDADQAGIEDHFMMFLALPLEQLWTLQDKDAVRLGRKTIANQACEGFRVIQTNPRFEQKTSIWANRKTKLPVLVEIITQHPSDPNKELVITLHDFKLNVELNETDFSLTPPEGYTLTEQKRLDELPEKSSVDRKSKKSKQAGQQLLETLDLWRKNKKTEAVKILLAIHWQPEPVFPPQAYYFTLSEQDYIALKQQDRDKVMQENMQTSKQVRQLARHVGDLGQKQMAKKNYPEAEKHFQAIQKFGQFHSSPERMLIVKMVGIAVETLGLKELITLYNTTNDKEKLAQAKKALNEVKAANEKIKQQAGGGVKR